MDSQSNWFERQPVRSYQDLIHISNSAATVANDRKALKLLDIYGSPKVFHGPKSSTQSSFIFVVNLIADYCKCDTKHALKIDAMFALIQCLGIAYLNAGHRPSCYTDLSNKTAHSNPLIGIEDLGTIWRAHRVFRARYGNIERDLRPITLEHRCSHAVHFGSVPPICF